MSEPIERRQQAATAGRRYLAGQLPWKEFIQQFGDQEDELIGNLVDLIEHEPMRGGLLGVNEKRWSEYLHQVTKAIAALEALDPS